MNEPKIVARHSTSVNCDPGVYFYCNCGLSSDGIFCDNSHEGTSFRPKRFRVDHKQNISICLCKYSKNKPFCDGEHRKLPE